MRLQEKKSRLESAELELARGESDLQQSLEASMQRLAEVDANALESSELMAGLEQVVQDLVAEQGACSEDVGQLRQGLVESERRLQEERLQER